MACRTTPTYICNILFVWQQSIKVKSSGQTPWQTNEHTQGSNQPNNHLTNQPTNHKVKLECDTRYHNPRCKQFVLSKTLRIFKVVLWRHRWPHHRRKKCIWQNLLCWSRFCSQILSVFEFYNHPIWSPNAVIGDLGKRKWNRILDAIIA